MLLTRRCAAVCVQVVEPGLAQLDEMLSELRGTQESCLATLASQKAFLSDEAEKALAPLAAVVCAR